MNFSKPLGRLPTNPQGRGRRQSFISVLIKVRRVERAPGSARDWRVVPMGAVKEAWSSGVTTTKCG